MSGSFSNGAVERPRGGRARASAARSCVRRGASESAGLEAERGQEAIALGDPLRRARLEVEHVAQEVLGRRVLVEPADQVGDGAVEVLGPDHGRVEQEAARARLHRPRLVVGHALEHLELDPRLDAVRLAQHEAVGDVEEVVAGDAQVDGRRVLGPAAVLEHALVVGVDLGLGLVGRLGPAVHARPRCAPWPGSRP